MAPPHTSICPAQLNTSTANVEMLAAGLETRRYISYMGATSEVRKVVLFWRGTWLLLPWSNLCYAILIMPPAYTHLLNVQCALQFTKMEGLTHHELAGKNELYLAISYQERSMSNNTGW